MSSIDAIASAVGPIAPQLGGELSSPDGAVTLMLSDIDSAELVAEQLGEERWDALLRDHKALVTQIVVHHDGQVVRWQEDGFLASFNGAHAGLHCAVELQRTFSGHSAGDAVKLRVGLHSGFVMGNPDQLLGRNVVLTARIGAQASGGEILVSSALKSYTEHDPRFSFEPRGEFYFKGVHGEHLLYAVPWQENERPSRA